ncbi:MAG: glucokinase [Simkaniaceae bacterium]
MHLAGDIGGTKTYLMLFDEQQEIVKEQKFKSKEYEKFSDLLKEFLQQAPRPVEKACFGIAGPVKKNRCQTTNLPWNVDGQKLSEELKISKIKLLNDLEANAYGIRTLEEEKFFILNSGEKEEGNQALISAGTGLGEAGIFYHSNAYVPFPSEGGHVDFSPRNDLEIELLQYLLAKFKHVSYERVLSGIGLANIFDFFAEDKKVKPKAEVLEAFKKENKGKVITDHALKNSCPACTKSLDLFVSLYGAEAGNVALKYLPVGGLFIGGGIAPKILDKLQEGAFMESFVRKGRLKDVLSAIPVKVILEENTALFGAIYYVRHCM